MNRRGTGWKSCVEIKKANGVSESTINGGFVLNGEMAMPTKLKSLTTIRSKEKMPPLHPGEMLREEFMRPLGISANALALALHVPVTRISEIVNERRSITADTALRLARYFRMPADFWMNLQTQYELETAEDAIAASIRREVRPAPRDRRTGALKHQATA